MTRCAMVIWFVLITGCSRPDKLLTFPSSDDGLFYTVEEYHAGGPVSDTDRVVAHLRRNGKSASIVVLEGGNLTIKNIEWNNQNDVTICIDGGITNTFRSQVTLLAGDSSATVHNHLDERCSTGRNPQVQGK
jgi:hypothetical protein